MAWGAWRGILGSVAAMLVAAAAVAQTPPSTVPPAAVKSPPKSAQTAAAKAKSPAIKASVKKPGSVPRARPVAVAKAKERAPARKIAEAPAKHEPAKKTVATRKPAAATRTAAIPTRPATPSYTVTTTSHGVTTTTTQVVRTPPLAAATAPPRTAVAALPASRAQPVVMSQPPARPAPVQTTTAPAAVAPPENATPAPPATAAAAAPDPKTAASFVAAFLKEAFHIARLDGATSLQRRAQLADLFSRKMDMRRIAGYTAAGELTDASADVQQRFRTILVSYLVETYYPQMELASDPSVKVETAPGQPLADGTAVVWTTFTKDGFGSQSVKWHLEPAAGGYRIVDIFSAGASVMQMERDTFQSVMRDGGLPELMAKLDARTKELASAATE